jgi:hypothetical protein
VPQSKRLSELFLHINICIDSFISSNPKYFTFLARKMPDTHAMQGSWQFSLHAGMAVAISPRKVSLHTELMSEKWPLVR